MQLLNRNKRLIQYATYSGSMSMVTDSDGFYTGERTKFYGSVTTLMAYVTPSRGDATDEMFGKDLDYDKVMYTTKDCPIDEFSLLWLDASSSAPNDYIVSRVAESLNHKAIAIKKVR